MGPIFYLVQSHGVRDPISAVVLADWPRESFPRPTSGPCTEPPGHLGLGAGSPRPQRPAALGKKAWREIRAIWTVRSAALCC